MKYEFSHSRLGPGVLVIAMFVSISASGISYAQSAVTRDIFLNRIQEAARSASVDDRSRTRGLTRGLVVPSATATPAPSVAARARPASVSGASAPAYVEQPAKPARKGVDMHVAFAFGSAQLTAQAESNLREFAAALQHEAARDYRFYVDGHTDAVGDQQANLRLSELRAAAVVGFLSREGVEPTRLLARGFGESDLVDHTAASSAVNRRVEAILVK